MAELKPWSLLLLRIGTGLLLMLWGSLRLIAPQAGPGLANKYYSGLLNIEAAQLAFGAIEVGIGALVILGLFRRVVYPLQALILVPGTLLLWRYLLDPLGLYLMSKEDSQILFFPSITVAAACLVLLAFRDEDWISIDHARTASRSAR
jgi:uncharacterized membrane protein YphA (DoxX/SURF4 family)